MKNKSNEVKIIQIFATSIPDGYNYVYGLGEDSKVYVWRNGWELSEEGYGE